MPLCHTPEIQKIETKGRRSWHLPLAQEAQDEDVQSVKTEAQMASTVYIDGDKRVQQWLSLAF